MSLQFLVYKLEVFQTQLLFVVVKITATAGQSWNVYIDGNPAGARSDNSNFATDTLIDGQVVTVESFTTNTVAGGGCSSFTWYNDECGKIRC